MATAKSVSAQLIAHLRQFRDEVWRPAVLRRTELCLLDSLGCFSAGLSLKHFVPSLVAAARSFGISADRLDSGTQISPFVMAYLYGQAANALDYDDTLLIGHPGAPIIGTVVAVAAREGLSADRLLRGIAAGYEVELILSASAAPSRERAAQVRSVGIWDAVAGAVGAGIALGLDDSALERLIGVAVAHSLLPYTAKWYERPAPGVKNNMGWAAAGAVLSMELTFAGQTGITNPLDGDAGMWRMAGSDRWNLDLGLSSKAGVLRTGFKHYPVCWHLQEYLKCLSHLLASMEQDDDVEQILLSGPRDIEKFCPRDYFDTVDLATSLPTAFSFLISGVEPGAKWGSLDGRERDLRYIARFRYECSDSRTIALHTRKGLLLRGTVPESEFLDRSIGCLDEAGVVAKYERLTDGQLRRGVAAALENERSEVPHELYRAINSILVNQLRQSRAAAVT